MQQISINWEPERRTYTVSELTLAIRSLLEGSFSDIWVAGEISGTKLAASGHYYFTLKDEESQLQCACFRQAARLLKVKPRDGLAVLARGRLDVYPPRGSYQLLVEAIEPQGYGALQLAFEQLKQKLAAEGLFDPRRKRPLPPFPKRIGIVTSPSGAAIRDLVHVLTRRFPGVHVRLYPARVQGEGSADEVVAGIDYLGGSGWPDVLIVGRGGGSLEDLWTFNEEAVARAIAACPVPVISAVGHETDFTIADFVADLRAPTPSAAAELAVPERGALLDRIEAAAGSLARNIRYRLAQARATLHERGIERPGAVVRRQIGRAFQRLDEADYRLRENIRAVVAGRAVRLRELSERLRRRDLRVQLGGLRGRLDKAETALAHHLRWRLAGRRSALEALAAQLRQLSPLRVLERGYAIVQDEGGRLITSAAQAPVGTRIGIRLSEGRLAAEVTGPAPGPADDAPPVGN